MTVLRPICGTGSSAIVTLPYYLVQSGSIELVQNVEIVAVMAKNDVMNLRAYAQVENLDIVDSCVELTVEHSEFLSYSAVYIPWDGNKNTIIRGRLNTNIFVYARGVMDSQTHATLGGYVGTMYSDLDTETSYCGNLQTTPILQTSTEQITTTLSVADMITNTTKELIYTTAQTTEVSTTEIRETSTLDAQTSTQLKETSTLEAETSTVARMTSTAHESTHTSITEEVSSTESDETTAISTPTATPTEWSTANQPEVATKTFAFEAYVVVGLKEVHDPVESPIALELGGSCVVLVLIFIIIIIAIDAPQLYRHFKMFMRNIRSICDNPILRERKMSDQLHLTNIDASI